jgi:hypothetical protein
MKMDSGHARAMAARLAHDVKVWKDSAEIVANLVWDKVDLANTEILERTTNLFHVFFSGAASLLPRLTGTRGICVRLRTLDVTLGETVREIDDLMAGVVETLNSTRDFVDSCFYMLELRIRLLYQVGSDTPN